MPTAPSFLEFFAGGGMARLGLSLHWHCAYSNEISEKKAAAYRANFGPSPELSVKDIHQVALDELPEAALAWASFPCQDLSLAGAGRGLNGERSGTFHAFWTLMDGLVRAGRAVPIIVLENVTGALTSNEGRDFRTLIETIANSGYRLGALVIDATHFVAQSRPRLFLIAIHRDCAIPPELESNQPIDPWHTRRIRSAQASLPPSLRRAWIWWNVPAPASRDARLTDILEPCDEWHTADKTAHILSLMAPAHRDQVSDLQRAKRATIGTIYKRIRIDEDGRRVQRAEVRFDQVSGCLRTPAGGSSRQVIIEVNGDSIRTRLLRPREAARLMGVPDSYRLPDSYTDAYHLMGDGVVVPVVAWLDQHLLHPLFRTCVSGTIASERRLLIHDADSASPAPSAVSVRPAHPPLLGPLLR